MPYRIHPIAWQRANGLKSDRKIALDPAPERDSEILLSWQAGLSS